MDSYSDKLREIAKFIGEDALASDVARKVDFDRLQRWADGTADEHLKYYLPLEFRRTLDDFHDATAMLSIEAVELGDGFEEDDEGNLWGKYGFSAKVTWASYAACNAEVACARAHFMLEVCNLAKAIKDRFSEPVRKIMQTKEEREKVAKEGHEKIIQETLRRIVEEHSYKMRVGSIRIATNDALTELPLGHFEVVVGERKYTVIHTDPQGRVWAKIIRTA